MKIWKVVLVLIAVLLFCGVVSACDSSYTNYGNGVLYFHKAFGYTPQIGCNYLEAGASMSQYLADHPEKHIVSIVPDAYIGYGLTGGFYVIVENKSVGKMDCEPNSALGGFGTTVFNYTCIEE
ncbi:MAG: hypothetical protein WCX79_00785 [Candidatus Paceibacterota bacterium]|jgi:hypothetical protein